MDDVPLSALLWALFVLLVLSGGFSLAETAMMAANRYRLRAAAQQGSRGAQLAQDLLAKTDKLLGVILLGNNLINAAAATLTSVIAIQLFGEGKVALGLGTVAVTFLILVFSEITPKVIGATYADRLAPTASFVLAPMLRLLYPVVWFVNLFVNGLLVLSRLKRRPREGDHSLSPEELRSLVLEAEHLIPTGHRDILLNLFALGNITMEDVMTPRGQIEAIDIDAPRELIEQQIATAYHSRLPVFQGDLNNILGVLHQRRVVSALTVGELDKDEIRSLLAKPYFIPASTPIFSQLEHFRENRQRLALVVDEYGEVVGLVSLEDIIQEIVGKFTSSVPGTSPQLEWDAEGQILVDGSLALREVNRELGLNLPLDGPKTLNGLILEHFQDIPEAGVSVRIAGVPMEVVQTQDRMVRSVRLFRPRGKAE